MPAAWKGKYRKIRKEFRAELAARARDDATFALMLMKTYAFDQQTTVVFKLIEAVGTRNREAYKQCICETGLAGKILGGSRGVFPVLSLSAPEIYEKYHMKIPGVLAMGDAYGVAKREINRLQRMEEQRRNENRVT